MVLNFFVISIDNGAALGVFFKAAVGLPFPAAVLVAEEAR